MHLADRHSKCKGPEVRLCRVFGEQWWEASVREAAKMRWSSRDEGGEAVFFFWPCRPL